MNEQIGMSLKKAARAELEDGCGDLLGHDYRTLADEGQLLVRGPAAFSDRCW